MPRPPVPDDLRVLVYARTWGPDIAPPAARRALRQHVRELGVEVTILSEGGVWSFHPDDSAVRFGAYTDRLVGDLATAATLLTRRPGAIDVFVVSANAVHRVPVGTTPLPDALALARPLVAQCLDLGGAPTAAVELDHDDVWDDVWPPRSSERAGCSPLALESPPS